MSPRLGARKATAGIALVLLTVAAGAVWIASSDRNDTSPDDAQAEQPTPEVPTSGDPGPAQPAPHHPHARDSTDPAPEPVFSEPPAPLELMVFDEQRPESSASEPSGNFRTICSASHLAADDPITAPGEPGTSHLHLFFGNTAVDAYSTADSLLTSGSSTCQGGILNRSGYWVPAVFDGDGKVVLPEFISVYYKGTGSHEQIQAVQPLPADLRMIAGFDATTGEADNFQWYCEQTQDKSFNIPECPDDELVGAVVVFPMCWDGESVDAPDHRSHMAYRERDEHTGELACPDSHPVHLPELTVGVWYPHQGDSSEWRLASDVIAPAGPGSSFHADWFGAWDREVLEAWTANCINSMLNCVDGELGDGRRLDSPEGPGWSGRVEINHDS